MRVYKLTVLAIDVILITILSAAKIYLVYVESEISIEERFLYIYVGQQNNFFWCTVYIAGNFQRVTFSWFLQITVEPWKSYPRKFSGAISCAALRANSWKVYFSKFSSYNNYGNTGYYIAAFEFSQFLSSYTDDLSWDTSMQKQKNQFSLPKISGDRVFTGILFMA